METTGTVSVVMENNESIKVQYLGFVQQIIARMASCSVAVKGACVALTAGLLAFVASNPDDVSPFFLLPLAVSILGLSVFDSKYLQQERCYRVLYGQILSHIGGDYDRSMKMPRPSHEDKTMLYQCYFSWSVLGFYLIVLFIVCLVVLFEAFPIACSCC